MPRRSERAFLRLSELRISRDPLLTVANLVEATPYREDLENDEFVRIMITGRTLIPQDLVPLAELAGKAPRTWLEVPPRAVPRREDPRHLRCH